MLDAPTTAASHQYTPPKETLRQQLVLHTYRVAAP